MPCGKCMWLYWSTVYLWPNVLQICSFGKLVDWEVKYFIFSVWVGLWDLLLVFVGFRVNVKDEESAKIKILKFLLIVSLEGGRRRDLSNWRINGRTSESFRNGKERTSWRREAFRYCQKHFGKERTFIDLVWKNLYFDLQTNLKKLNWFLNCLHQLDLWTFRKRLYWFLNFFNKTNYFYHIFC